MRERDFRIVFAEWKKAELPELIPREIEIPKESDMIISIVGPRQAGKTYRTLR